ncbi:hypothetical protein NDU88_005674 [Pleurodeles waltl]|uniref:Uncharacterized protein n=1 Tax=Pleurodeles waltl TaxID=8319 RepID=A0AAV7RPW2_PLEWA|nr:hypothetical protein NDU88_005674 [Pleurodeles waltl]
MINVIRTQNIRGFWQLVRKGQVTETMWCLVGEEDWYKYLSTVYDGIDTEEGYGVIRKTGQDGSRESLAVGGFLLPRLLFGVLCFPPLAGRIMRAVSDCGMLAYTCGNYPSSGITRGSSRSSLADLSDFGHNGRGFVVLTFVIFLAPQGKQWRMAPKAARGSRLKPGSQDRRPLDSQPPARGGISRNSSFGNAGSCENVFEGRQPVPGSSAALGRRTG